MARIKNTNHPEVGTHSLYDEETMGEHYDPPGIVFSEQGGAVARVKQEVVDDVVAKYPHFERIDNTSTDTDDSTSTETDDTE